MAYTRTLLIDGSQAGHVLETRITLPSQRAGNALIAPPHPSYGGSIDSPVVEALEQALCARGFGTLAFNFRGVGESSGNQRGDLNEGLTDFLAVARAPEAAPLTLLAGYSFGACVALKAARALAIQRLVLVAPALGLFEPELLHSYGGRLSVVVGGEDDYAPAEELRALLPRSAVGSHAEPSGPTSTVRFEVLPGVDHFFSGGGLLRLRNALPVLLG